MSKLKAHGALAAMCVTLTGGFEGCRQLAYKDPVGIPTVCFGETRGVRLGQHYTRSECDAMLMRRLDEFADGMEKCTHRPMPDNVYAAHLSLSYNIGTHAYCKSSARKLWDEGERRASCNAILKWDKARGVALPGLTVRRHAERDLCLKGV